VWGWMYYVGKYQISLVPRTVSVDPKLRTFRNRLVGAIFVSAPFRVLGLPCKGLINQLSASHPYLRLLNQLAMISLNDGTL
jgi:hypothetical protein